MPTSDEIGQLLRNRPLMRAIRRHHRERTLRRRKRIARQSTFGMPEELPPQIMHWHFRCNCFECAAERHAERRRQKREWQQFEEVA